MIIEEIKVKNIEEIRQKYNLTSLCAKVLASKDLSNDQIEEVLSPAKLQDPFHANGMKEVIERIQLAKSKKEKVLVCGDYDADGICATTILYDALCKSGVNCGFYIPNRLKEGYGLHVDTVRLAKEKGYQLLITVDNGVKAFSALEEAQKLAIDVILSDHHSMDDEPLPCQFLLHPFHMGEDFQYLCGAGVALEISRALIGDCKEHLALACVATIGDCMPLWKESRAIVRLGMQYLQEGVCQPLQFLRDDIRAKWDEELIAFQIVPKLNATGRLADIANANNTVRYLLSNSLQQIQAVSKQIKDLNNTRKVMSEEMYMLAKSLVQKEDRFLIVSHEQFHEGLVGLIAGKLFEDFQQPVMVLTKHGNTYKGSIRSGDFLDLTTFFQDFDGLLAYGGHRCAAGIGFDIDKLDSLKEYVQNKMQHISMESEKKYSVLKIDEKDLSLQEVESLQLLAPFGQGFEKPLFYVKDCDIQKMNLLKEGKHVKWETMNQMECLYFHVQEKYKQWVDKKKLGFIGHVRVHTFRAMKKVNLFVQDIL